jgi:hypothetical protein
MAWAGLELIGDSLFPRIENCEVDALSEWCHLLRLEFLPDPIGVPGGVRRAATIRNLWAEDVEILDYVQIRNKKSRRLLDAWWVKQAPIADYCTALQTARAFRDLTAHGLLSANRVEKFGLISRGRNGSVHALDRLVNVTVVVALETLNRLLATTGP